ncbi:MAG: UbiA family prenyltransferase [Verrucomicrobiota bacterium]
MSPKLRGWLILTRGSNLPTVWSNVLAGWLLAQGLRLRPIGSEYAAQAPDPLGWDGLLLLLLGVSLTYAGGMILNDAFDARWDAERRSTRPIPAGLITVGEALRAGWGALVLGFLFTVLAAPAPLRMTVAVVALLLMLCVLLYDRWHKGVAWAPAVMGACRALLPPLGFFVAGERLYFLPLSDADWIMLAHMSALWLLTFAITLVARHESTGGVAGRRVEALLFLAPVPLFFAVGLFWPWMLLWSAAYAWWLVRSNRRHPLPGGVGARVADRLAAMPLIDAMTNGYLAFVCLGTLHKRKGVHPEALFDAACLALLALTAAPLALRLVLRWRKQIPST